MRKLYNGREYFFSQNKKYIGPCVVNLYTVISAGYYVRITKSTLKYDFDFMPILERLMNRSIKQDNRIENLEKSMRKMWKEHKKRYQ